jgi:hypothetical protein
MYPEDLLPAVPLVDWKREVDLRIGRKPAEMKFLRRFLLGSLKLGPTRDAPRDD